MLHAAMFIIPWLLLSFRLEIFLIPWLLLSFRLEISLIVPASRYSKLQYLHLIHRPKNIVLTFKNCGA
jgi:hypothetical protein